MSLREIRLALEGRREQDEAFKARLSGYTEDIKNELRRRGIPVRTPNMTGIEREMQLRKRLVLALDRGACAAQSRGGQCVACTRGVHGTWHVCAVLGARWRRDAMRSVQWLPLVSAASVPAPCRLAAAPLTHRCRTSWHTQRDETCAASRTVLHESERTTHARAVSRNVPSSVRGVCLTPPCAVRWHARPWPMQ